MRALIAGGGIGGLTTALALDRIGLDVDVFESVHEIRPLGVGINLLPRCVRIFDELGALDRLLGISSQTKELVFFNRFGQEIWTEPRGIAAGYKWPQLAIHRGWLQQALFDLARERLGRDRIRTGHHLATFSDDGPDGVTAEFVDCRTGTVVARESGDLLIGADGIHSTVRSRLHPGEGPAKWNGGLIWRGTTPAEPFLSGRSQIAVGGLQTFIAYPITPEPLHDGRWPTNWAARIFVDPARGFAREDWDRRGNAGDVLPLYESWRFDWLDVPDLIARTEEIYEYPLVDRDPLDRWTFGRVTLLGDAAHPMYPLGSNGASQAVLDAHALAGTLTREGNVDRALAAYEEERRPRTAQIVRDNRAGGPEIVIRMVEERAPNGFSDLASVISSAELEEISGRYKRLAGFDVASVNA